MKIIKVREFRAAQVEPQSQDTFYNAMRPIIFGAQFFGCMPLRRTLSTNVNDIYFEWRCPQVLYAFMLMAAGIINICLLLRVSFIFEMSLIDGGKTL